MKRFLPLVLVAIFVFAVMVVNKGINQNAVSGGDTDLAKATGLYDEPTPKPDAAKPPAAPAGQAVDPAPLEMALGQPSKAKVVVTIGWTYDKAAMQTDNKIADIVQIASDWQKEMPSDRAVEIVNLDAPSSDVSAAARQIKRQGIVIHMNGRQHGRPDVTIAANPATEFKPGMIAGLLHSVR